MLKFKKLQAKEKLKKLVEFWELLATPVHHCKACILDNISLSYKLVEYYFSSFLQRSENVVKSFIMLKVQSPDKLTIIYCQFFINYFFHVKINF